jgi:hypothetical protein
MSLFGPPNIMKLEKKYDYSGLIKAAHYRREPDIRIQALEALTSRNLLYSKESAKFQKEIASLLADLAKNDPDPNVQVAAVRGIQKLGNKYGAMDAARLQVIELAGLFNNYLNIGADNLAAEVVAALLSLEPSKKILPSDAETTNNLVTFLTRQISQGKLQSAGQTAMLLMNLEQEQTMAAILKKLPQATRLELYTLLFKELPNPTAKVARILGFRETIPLLMKYLSPNCPEVIKALAAVGAKEALQPLLNMFIDKYTGDTDAQIEAIGQLGDASTVDLIFAPLKNNPRLTYNSRHIRVLEALGKHDSSILTSAFRDDLPLREWEALMEALGDVKDEKTVPVILAQVKRNPTAAFLPQLMYKLNDNRFAPFLASYLGDQQAASRADAAGILGELFHPVVIPALLKVISGEDEVLAKKAAKALEKQKNKPISEADKLLILKTASQLNKLHVDSSSHVDEGNRGSYSDCTHSDYHDHTDRGPRIQF